MGLYTEEMGLYREEMGLYREEISLSIISTGRKQGNIKKERIFALCVALVFNDKLCKKSLSDFVQREGKNKEQMFFICSLFVLYLKKYDKRRKQTKRAKTLVPQGTRAKITRK